MSMRDYAVNDYGMLLDDETALMLANGIGYILDDYNPIESAKQELYEGGYCEYIGEFTGEAIGISDNGLGDWSNTIEFCRDTIHYIVLRYPTLFHAPYKNMDDVVDELKEKIGEYLPDDFDYRSRICEIVGTYFG